jgi:DNA-binding transcriptional MerR regulator
MNSELNLLNEQQAAEILHISVKTLQAWRQRKVGPRYYRLSNRVRYQFSDLLQYISDCAVTASPER